MAEVNGRTPMPKAMADGQLALALEHFARVTLGLTGIFQIKFGRAIPRFPAVSEASHYTILAWIDDIASPLQFQADGHDQCTT